MRLAFAAGTVFLLVSVPLAVPAWAHVRMVNPTPRSPEDGNKTGPCGPAPPTAPVEVQGGQVLTVTFEETIDHPGWFRVAFSPPGELGFEDNVLADMIPDVQGGTLPRTYTHDVLLPSEGCEGCVMQLIQYMTEDPLNPSLYYSCADVTILAAALDGGVGPDADPLAPDAAPAGPPDASAPMGDDFGDPPGLCAAAGVRARSAWSTGASLILLAAAALLVRRRL